MSVPPIEAVATAILYNSPPLATLLPHLSTNACLSQPVPASCHSLNKGCTLLHLAASVPPSPAHPLPLLLTLVPPGHAAISARDNGGVRPLHLAALHDNAQAVHALLAHGARVTCRTRHGKTPADLAGPHAAQAISAWLAHRTAGRCGNCALVQQPSASFCEECGACLTPTAQRADQPRATRRSASGRRLSARRVAEGQQRRPAVAGRKIVARPPTTALAQHPAQASDLVQHVRQLEQQQQHLLLMARAAATAPAVVPLLCEPTVVPGMSPRNLSMATNGYSSLALTTPPAAPPLALPIPVDVPGSPAPLSSARALQVLGPGPIADLVAAYNVQVFSFDGDPSAPGSFALLRYRQLFMRPDFRGGSSFSTAVDRLHTAGQHAVLTMLGLASGAASATAAASSSSSPPTVPLVGEHALTTCEGKHRSCATVARRRAATGAVPIVSAPP